MIRAKHARPGEQEIFVTPHDIILIEARPPVSSDEVAYYSNARPVMKSRGVKLFLFWSVAIAAAWLCAFLILSPFIRAAINLVTGGLP